MKIRNLLAALLLMVVCSQTIYAQGFRVYNSDGTVLQFSLRTDSIVFYDGIGSEQDLGLFTPVNQMIVGTWYKSKSESVTFYEDGTTDFKWREYDDYIGVSYEFFPFQGNLIIYSSNRRECNLYHVAKLTKDSMIIVGEADHWIKSFIYTRTQPVQYVTSITLSETSLTLQPDDVETLTATVFPEDADNKELIWESNDENVAEVNGRGRVIANGNGTCVITCRATDGSGVYAECYVTVNSTDIPSNVALLNMQIDSPDYSNDNYTRIYVRSVTFEGFSTKGTSDLNSDWIKDNSASNWFDISSSEITIYDGRRDGREAISPASNERTGLNSLIVQSKPYTTSVENGHYNSFYSDPDEPGVTNTLVNLFNSTVVDAPVFVIPTQEQLKITIVYDVETADYNLYSYLSDGVTRGSCIENRISKSITLSDGSPVILECGKKYVVKLHLGINSIMVETEVSEF